MLFEQPLYFEGKKGTSTVEVSMQYNDNYNETVFTFAIIFKRMRAALHLTGFRNALTKTINDYARKYKLLKENDQNLSGEDVREGLTAVISVKLEEPQFEGRLRQSWGTAEIRPITEAIVGEKLADFLEKILR